MVTKLDELGCSNSREGWTPISKVQPYDTCVIFSDNIRTVRVRYFSVRWPDYNDENEPLSNQTSQKSTLNVSAIVANSLTTTSRGSRPRTRIEFYTYCRCQPLIGCRSLSSNIELVTVRVRYYGRERTVAPFH